MNMLITTSFDGKIKFFEKRDLSLISQFELPRDGFIERSNETHGGMSHKTRPVVGMVFSKAHSNTFITWGFGTTIHLWNPYFSISNPYQSSYKPHAGIIKDCRFLNSSSFCVSLDNKLSLRIWNMKSMETVQVINLELKAPSLSRIIVFSNDSLLVAGRKLLYLTNAEVEGKLKNLDEVFPIYAHFNDYFKVFVVVTEFDVRVYNWTNGELIDV